MALTFITLSEGASPRRSGAFRAAATHGGRDVRPTASVLRAVLSTLW